VTIPLTNAQLELLSVHFATDPGANFDWRGAAQVDSFELSPRKKLDLIGRYMDVKVCPLSTGPAASLDRRRGSLDSAKAGWMQDDPRWGQGQGHGRHALMHGAVMKAFGSLGQSVAQKLKSMTDKSQNRNAAAVGRVTQSSRRSHTPLLHADNTLSSQRHEVLYIRVI